VAGLNARELRPGLWRWTAPHPDWEPTEEQDGPADWPRDVGSVLAVLRDTVVLVDPLVPDDGWNELDALVSGRPAAVVTTIDFHGRSREAAVVRYGASEEVPLGVDVLSLSGLGERIVWLPAYRALVPGDRLLGFGGDTPLRLCPDQWLRYLPGKPTRDELREALVPLLALPIELVLVSHGEPVLENGRAELERALGA